MNSRKRLPHFERVTAKYPEQADLIRRLLLCSPSFRNLCEDYVLLLDAVDKFEKPSSSTQRSDRDDCLRLILELELDIARTLLRVRVH